MNNFVATRTSPTRPINVPKIFNRKLKGMHKSMVSTDKCTLHQICAEQMLDRRAFIKRQTPVVLDVGCGSGWYLRKMIETKQLFGLKQYIQTDISEERLNANYKETKDLLPPGVELVQICTDEECGENPFGIPKYSVDMCVSNLGMHWVNDLENTMVNIRRVLKKDGFVLMCMFGGNTLFELRSAFTMAQQENKGGLAPFTSPMIDGAGVSTLMLQSGYTLPTIDMDRHVLTYKSPFHLMEHLGDMGEGAAFMPRKSLFLDRTTCLGMAGVYEAMYSTNNVFPATFEIFHCIGWSPAPTQQKPLERGSAQLSMQSLNTPEHKELQKILEEYSMNPDSNTLQDAAEKLYQQLIEKERGRIETYGMDVPENRTTKIDSKPIDPPFQKEGGKAARLAQEAENKQTGAAEPKAERKPLPDTPKMP